MRMSISTTSGRVRRTTSTALRPSAASPTTSHVGLGVDDHAEARTQQRWSSAITTLIRRGGGSVAPPRGAGRRRATHLGGRDALAEAAQPHRARAAGCCSATRGPAIWQTTSEARISPGSAASQSRAATITGVPYRSSPSGSGSPASSPTLQLEPAGGVAVARCIADRAPDARRRRSRT